MTEQNYLDPPQDQPVTAQQQQVSTSAYLERIAELEQLVANLQAQITAMQPINNP